MFQSLPDLLQIFLFWPLILSLGLGFAWLIKLVSAGFDRTSLEIGSDPAAERVPQAAATPPRPANDQAADQRRAA